MATLSYATWNINSLDILMLQVSIDVIVLIDSRHSAIGLKSYVQPVLYRLVAGTGVYRSTDASRKTDESGGIITIMGSIWGPSYE